MADTTNSGTTKADIPSDDASTGGDANDRGANGGGSNDRGSSGATAAGAARPDGARLREDYNALRADIDALRADVAKLRGSGGELAADAVATARERLEAETDRLLERLESFGGEAEREGRRILDEAERELRENPLRALAWTFGTGLLLGWLFRRR